jgi:hypothetical protein
MDSSKAFQRDLQMEMLKVWVTGKKKVLLWGHSGVILLAVMMDVY